MASKLVFAQRCQELATSLGQRVEVANDLVSAYFDRSYNGGLNVLIDSDVSSLGITAADVQALITLMQQLQNFVNNVAVVQGDYGATLSKMRTDV